MSFQLSNFHPLRKLFHHSNKNEVDDFFKEFDFMPSNGYFNVAPRIKLDVSESGDAYVVKAEIPGVEKDNIQVSVDGNQVSISVECSKENEQKDEGEVICSERYVGQQFRSFTLDSEIDKDKASASYRHGVLKLELPKLAGRSNGHKLAVS